MKIETGKKYGRVVIIRRLEIKLPPSWLVKCDCGQYDVLSGLHFKRGGWICCRECWEAGHRSPGQRQRRIEQLAYMYRNSNLYGGHNIDYRDRQELISEYEEAGLHAQWGKLNRVPDTEDIHWEGREWMPDFVSDDEIDEYISSVEIPWAEMILKVDNKREEISTKHRMTKLVNKIKKQILG